MFVTIHKAGKDESQCCPSLNPRPLGWASCFSESGFYFLPPPDLMQRVNCPLPMLYTLCGKHFLEERRENRTQGDPWLNMVIPAQSVERGKLKSRYSNTLG